MAVKENCTLPEDGNACSRFNCSSCGWDRNVLAARKEMFREDGFTVDGGIAFLKLLKEKTNECE